MRRNEGGWDYVFDGPEEFNAYLPPVEAGARIKILLPVNPWFRVPPIPERREPE